MNTGSLAQVMIADMANADELFRPTNFWQTGIQPIVDDIARHGVENFREHPSATRFYSPVYGYGAYSDRYRSIRGVAGLAGKRISRFLDDMMLGRQSAFEDYRLFKAIDTAGGLPLHQIEESNVGGGQRFEIDGKSMSRSFLNYLRGMAFLKKHTGAEISTILEIGGGYGSLGEILLKAKHAGFYMNVDIPPVAAVSTWYLREVFGHDAVFDYRDARDLDTIDLDAIRTNYRAAVLCPWQLPKVTGSFDLFANFISFQEMEPGVVENYARLAKGLTADYVLLRSSSSGKAIAKAGQTGVFEPTTADRIVGYFNPEFDVVARDAYAAGQSKLSGSLTSEVIVMKPGH